MPIRRRSPLMSNRTELLQAALRVDLPSFTRKCFNTIAQGTPFVENWHLQAIAHELQRVRNGDVNRLTINLPPRSLKSIPVSVAFVAWLLGHDPTLRIIVASYSFELAVELHRQFRMIVLSDWY